MPETVSELPQSSLEQPKITRRAPARRISEHDVEEMAKLVAKRLTETDACHFLEIRPQSWLQWKSRHKNSDKFEHIIARIRTAKFEANWQNIEVAGKKDWRASREVIAMLLPQTHGDQGTQVNVQVGLYQQLDNQGELMKSIQRGFARVEQAKQIAVEGQAKLLVAPADSAKET